MDSEIPLTRDKAAGPLGRWYGDPLSHEQAEALLHRAQLKQQSLFRHGRSCISCALAEMVARYWLGEQIDQAYQRLVHRCRNSSRARALLDLIYGQLLMSRREEGAWEYLERGFEKARLLFSPADYFLVLQRHKQLKHLPLSKQPLNAEPLSHLLTSARVIEQLEKSTLKPRSYSSEHRDTFD